VKEKRRRHAGVQELCRKLKDQLEALSVELTRDTKLADEEVARRNQLLERLKNQLNELST
jgi:hypothetical protein